MDFDVKSAKKLRKFKDSMTDKQFLEFISMISKAINSKKLKTARNRRYYLKHRKDILATGKLKNKLFQGLIEKTKISDGKR